MKWIEKLYYLLVNRIPVISVKYQAYRKQSHGIKRVFAWLYLMKLNIQYYLLGRGKESEQPFYNTKKLYLGGSESSISHKESPADFAKKLSKYDVVSFDVFDTLIFRPFSDPTDIFYLVGAKLGYLNFRHLRIEAEKELRIEKLNTQGSGEITLSEIWEKMEKITGISKEKGEKVEWQYEKKYCFANPYMLEVVKELKKLKCTYIVISDMYLSKEKICTLLKEKGYPDLSKCFVSSEYKKSKADGSLYGFVKDYLGKNKSYIHVGDNFFSDIKKAESAGFKTEWYPNINERGAKYRAEDMSMITGSVYRGIVNSHIHNGLRIYSMAYEYGFIYGGLFVMGYCNWIHSYVKQNGIDKILFLARDGDILSKAYKILYPQAIKGIDYEYVYWSRLAATKLSAGYFKYDFFRRFLMHKVNQGYVLKDVFASMDLQKMLVGFLTENSRRYTETNQLTEQAAEDIRKYLSLHWDNVLENYSEQSHEGKKYYEKVLADCKNIVAVDVGWAGSGAVTLDYMINQVWGLQCNITGLVAGTNSFFSEEQDASEPLLRSGKLVSYMFSQEHNRDIWKIHNPNRGHNIIVELLLASEENSFRGFTKQGITFSEKKGEINAKEVQRGILDFVALFLKRMGGIEYISGRDAYAPIKILIQNEEWLRRVISIEKIDMNLD